MHITAERAFWIFDYYRRHSITLVFGGTILGEEGACHALVTLVSAHDQAIGITLLSDNSKEAWDRAISFACARFSLIQMGDIEFQQINQKRYHSILITELPGGTIIFFAEPLGTIMSATAHAVRQKQRITCAAPKSA